MNNKYYPKEVYNINIDVTMRNKARYDAAQEKIRNEIVKRYPNYYSMSFKERYALRYEIREIEEMFPWF